MKVQLTVSDDLMTRADNYCKDNYITRSSLLTLALSQFLNSAEAYKEIHELTIAFKTIAEKGLVDDSTKAKLDGFERFARMFTGK